MTRRDALAWLGRAAAAVAATELCGVHAHAADNRGSVKIADLISLKNEQAVMIANPELILARTKSGLASFSVYCTHRRNKLDVEKDGSIFCAVHGSIFDSSGKPVSGPASRPLTWYLTSVDDDGAVSADSSKTVAYGEWASLPAWAKPAR